LLAWPKLKQFVADFVSQCSVCQQAKPERVPLTNLLKKGVLFLWTSETQAAFDALKQALISAPVLQLPNFSKPFCIETDASDKAVGAVLQQEGHPLAYVSKALSIKSQGLSTYDKECLAIMIAVDHWRPYLQHSEFILKIDHKSLLHLDDQRLTTPWQHKALTKLMGLNFKILYKKGSENSVAAALSRATHQESTELAATSVLQLLWLTDLQNAYLQDPELSELLQQLSVSSPVGHFSLNNGLIKFKERLWLGSLSDLHHKITTALHASPLGGHSGMEATYLRCFVHACPTKWSNWLSLAEFWYNTSFHSSLNKTPFYVMYGHEPRQLGIDVEINDVDDLDEWLKDRSLMQQLLQQHLLRAQKKMKTQVDKKHSSRSFAVADHLLRPV